jgi:dipeptidyl aminopeptidase/acylaminoacyl peptidase
VADVRVLRWPSGDGREIEGLLFEPLGYRRGQRYPMIVQVNGANNLYPSYYQSYAHQLAGRGYLVLQVNHRALGSTGYGEAFKLETYPPNAVLDHATQDILTGISALVKDGVADGDRVGLMGWSIGGFTANWLMTRTSQFKAISTGAGNADMVAAYGQIDQYRYYYRNSWGGSAFRSWDYYTSLSPLRFMERAATPTLIHVGEHDDGVTLQCRETYNALQEFGVPVEMLVHVGQSHNLQAPQSLLAKMLADVAWFEQWIRGGPSWLGWQADFDSIVRGR